MLVRSAHGTGSLLVTLLVTSSWSVTLLVTGGTTQLAASSPVQSWMPSRRLVSEGSSGGKEERGARNGLVQVLETGGRTEEEERKGLKVFLEEDMKGLTLVSAALHVGTLA